MRARLRTIPARSWVDIGVLGFLALLGLLGFATSFDHLGYLLAGVGGLVVGALVGVLAAWLRLGPVLTILLAALAYFLFGSPLAMPAQATLTVLPSAETLAGLARGAVFGWADIVTLSAPVDAPDYIGVLPYISGAVVGLVSATIAARWMAQRRRGWLSAALALLAPVVLYAVGVLTGTADPYLAAVRGVLFALVALVWVAWRPAAENSAASPHPGVLRRRLLGVGGVVVVAAVGGSLIGAVAAPAPSHRYVLREHVQPPFDPLQYASPLSGFRHYTKSTSDATLFTVSGLHSGDRIRIATMDSYNGQVWNVTGPDQASGGSGTFGLAGARLPQAPLVTSAGREKVVVTVGSYHDVWMPTTGYAQDVAYSAGAPSSIDVRYNAATGILIDTGTVSTGQRYSLEVERQKVPKDSALEHTPVADLSLPPISNVPDLVGVKATEFVGKATTPIDKLRALETAFKQQGVLSHGTADDLVPSRAGHGADRMKLLLSQTPMVGDEEQYASAFALMARSMGYPARVVMGFAPKRIPASGSVAVKSKDVTAWVEVAFRGVGWIPFSPTPPAANVPQVQTSKPKTEPLPQVRQPPRTLQNQDDLVSPTEVQKDKKDATSFAIPGWVWTVAEWVGIPLVALLVPPLLVGVAKSRRRRRRRRRGSSDRRAAGAWNELVDVYAELGYLVPPSATRVETALAFEEQLRDELAARERERDDAVRRAESGDRDPLGWRPGVADPSDPLPALPGLREFAVATDTAVFGGVEVADSVVDGLWTRLDTAEEAARGSVSWFRRRLSAVRMRLHRRPGRLKRPGPVHEGVPGVAA